jgi:hypothetical protein
MASQPPSISRQEASALVRQVQSPQLINRQLSSICQVNGIKSTGVKAELQRRIMNRKFLSLEIRLLFFSFLSFLVSYSCTLSGMQLFCRL